MNYFFDDDFEDIDPDEIDDILAEYDEGFVEDKDSGFNQDNDDVEPREEYFGFDPFCLGAGFGYEMGREEWKKKTMKITQAVEHYLQYHKINSKKNTGKTCEFVWVRLF